MNITIRKASRSVERFASFYSGADDAEATEFIVPEDLSVLSDEELEQLHTEAVSHFDSTYGDGSGLNADTIETLSALTVAIETLAGEKVARHEAQLASQQEAEALASRVKGTLASDEEPIVDEVEELSKAVANGEMTEDDEDEDDSMVASAVAPQRQVIKLPSNRGGLRQAQTTRATAAALAAKGVKSVVKMASTENGFTKGDGVDFDELGRALNQRLTSFNVSQYEQAHKMKREMRELSSFATISRPIPSELVIQSNDFEHVDRVLARATSEKDLKGGSLVASGGWHAPSEVLYDQFLELESRDGILSLPEIGVARGGVQITPGPSFAEIYADIEGFSFTEQNDIDSEYAVQSGVAVSGAKPVYHVTGPEFTDYRLGVSGLIIQAGLLGARGYPEHLARVIRGALVAHDHRINGDVLGQMATGSTAVTMTAGQVGAAAPVLSAIELQAEHYRDTHRLARGATLEAVFPYWVRGAIRSDLSRRLGVDMINVSDATIAQWFALRGIAPQFVYDWQGVASTAVGSFTAWPTSVSFLLYAAGTWVKGVSDILTLDTLYDSTLLGQNDFTALFTEEGWFVAKRGHDSRLVTTSISATGAAHIGDDIAHTGAAV